MLKHGLKATLASWAVVAFLPTASAQDTITLKMAGFLPATHYAVVEGSEPFMKEVTEKTNGRVKFEFYPGQQLGKAGDLLNLLQAGVLDIAEVATNYFVDKLPLSGVIEIPGLASSSCAATNALRALVDPGGVIYESEYAPNGIRVIALEILSPYTVISRTPIDGVESLKGLKIRPSGSASELAMSALGAVSVKMPSLEMYDGISRGTIDGTVQSFLASRDFALPEVAKHASDGYGFGTGGVLFMMREDKLQSLPEDIRQAILESGAGIDKSFCNYVDDNEEQAKSEAVRDGVNIYKFTDEDVVKLDTALEDVGLDWAEKLERSNIPAKKALEEFTRIARQ